MRKFIRFLLAASMLVLLALTVSAQGESWRAYILVGQEGRLLAVGPNGQEAAYSLDLPPGSFVNAAQMRFTNDGTRAAYCLLNQPPRPDNATTYTLVVRDIINETNIVQRDLGAIAGCTVSAFDGASNRVAAGIVTAFPQENVAVEPGGLWSLQLIDATSGTPVSTLNDASPGVPTGADLLPDFPDVVPIMAEVKLIAGDIVVFTAIPWVGRGGAFALPAYAWNVTTGDIGPAAPEWGEFGTDYLPTTGELAYAAADPDRPAGVAGGPMPMNNVVRVLDASGNTTTVFHDPTWLVTQVTFVNGGRQLAIQLIDSFNPQSQNPSQDYRVVLLNRDGTRVDALRYPNYLWLEDVPGGFVTLWSEVATAANPAPPTYIDYFEGSGGGVRVWTFAPQEEQPVFWEMAWATPDTPVADLPPFPTQ